MNDVFQYKEECTIVSPDLAKIIGLNEAIILQKLNDLIEQNKYDNNYFRDGSIWTKQSVSVLREKYFPFMSVSSIKRTMDNLEKMKLIYKKKFNVGKFENVNWYAIDYKAVEYIIMSEVDITAKDASIISRRDQNELIDEQLLKELEEMEL